MTPDSAPYRWDFEKDGKVLDVAVEPQLTTNDMGVMIRTACSGGGITFGLEDAFRPYIEKGRLIPQLEPWLPVFEGFYLYFPKKNRNISPRMRALINHMRY